MYVLTSFTEESIKFELVQNFQKMGFSDLLLGHMTWNGKLHVMVKLERSSARKFCEDVSILTPTEAHTIWSMVKHLTA